MVTKHYKISLLIIVMLFCLFSGKAQVSINLFQSPAQFSIYDFEQTAFINQSQASINVIVRFTVNTDLGENIITITTKNIELKPAINMLQKGDIDAADFKYSANKAALQFRQTGVLPFGKYVVCAQVNKADDYSLLENMCQEQVSLPFAPPKLIYPSDGEELDNPYPMLLWLAPVPDGDGQIEYDLKLVKMKSYQEQYEALQNNYAYYKLTDYGEESVNYPIDAAPLEINTWYAWHVTAKYKGQNVGETETWKFKIKDVKVDTVIKVNSLSYPVINYNLEGRMFKFSNKLYFAYNNDYRETKLKYRIVEYGSTKEYPNKEELGIKTGNNLCVLDISDSKFFKPNSNYVLEVINQKGTKYQLQFQKENGGQ